MKAKAMAIGTPSAERYIRAASKFAVGAVSCLARRPLVFAGERRKILVIWSAAHSVAQPPQRLLQQLVGLLLVAVLAAANELVGLAQVADDGQPRHRLGGAEGVALDAGDLVVDGVLRIRAAHALERRGGAGARIGRVVLGDGLPEVDF